MKSKFSARTSLTIILLLMAATLLIALAVAYFVPIKLRILASGDLPMFEATVSLLRLDPST